LQNFRVRLFLELNELFLYWKCHGIGPWSVDWVHSNQSMTPRDFIKPQPSNSRSTGMIKRPNWYLGLLIWTDRCTMDGPEASSVTGDTSDAVHGGATGNSLEFPLPCAMVHQMGCGFAQQLGMTWGTYLGGSWSMAMNEK
jgi:hypothetical protein